jgi:hypothetical protein
MNLIINQIKNLAFSTQVAIHSFAIGTLLFLLSFVINQNILLYYVGYIYVLIAAIINSLILLWLLYYLIKNKNERQEILIEIFILLANIPIALFYFFIVVEREISNSPF